MITSLLDTDLYKLTMQQAVMQLYPRAMVKYEFINRGKHEFRDYFGQELRNYINGLGELKVGADEIGWMRHRLPFLTPAYLDFFKGYQFNPGEVRIRMEGRDLKVEVVGPWYSAILWEVPLMAMISELYYRSNHQTQPQSLEKRVESISQKAGRLRKLGVKFADFGTRRRYSQSNHDHVIFNLIGTAGKNFVGISNLHFAMKYGLKPIGTQAHEWFQFHGAKYGFRIANQIALERWVDVYQGDLGIALSDTYTSDIFLKSFGMKYAKLFDGVRQDSGGPIPFMHRMVDHYIELGIDPRSKTIVFSDGLDVTLVQAIEGVVQTQPEEKRIKTAYGIGTNLTNDVGVKPMNIVIKMTACRPEGEDWIPAIKLSDDKGKNTGDADMIELCKQALRI